MQKSTPATGPSSGQDGAGLDSRRRFKLLEDCRGLVLDQLSSVVTLALDKMADDLTADALKSSKGEHQRALLDAVMLVREQRSALEQRFRRYFSDIFERRLFATGDARDSVAEPLSSDELTLVSEEVISDKIDVDRLIQRARSRLDPNEVLGIRARLGALLERDWFDEGNHPASPEAIYEALRTTVHELAPSPEVRQALLAAFEPHVSRSLNAIYNTVNTQLVANQVLPKIRPRVSRTAGMESRGAGKAGAAPLPGQVGAAGADGLVSVSQSMLSSLQQAMIKASVGSPQARGDAARLLSDPSMFGVADLPIEPVGGSLLETLTEMQVDLAADPRYAGQAGAEGLALPAGAEAGSDTDGASARMVMDLLPLLIEKVKAGGTPLDQMTVELVSVVFDYIYADKGLAEPVKHQLLRLQVVAVKAALLDRSFFARRQHPMRQLIDRITMLAADPDADLAVDAPLVTGLSQVVDKLVAEFTNDLSAFLVAIDKIDELAQQETARRAEQLAAQLEAAAREEAFSLALEQARSAIAARIDHETPSFVREFLLRWWTPVIARSGVEGGVDPSASTQGAGKVQAEADGPGQKALKIAEFLIWSVTPKHPEEIPRLAGLLPRLIKALNEGARAVDVPESERTNFMQELLEAHAKIIESAKVWQSGQPDPRAADVRLRSDGSVRFSRERRARVDEPQTIFVGETALAQFERGDRVEVIGESGASRVYKLAWISPARKLFILSRYPQETLTFTAADFAALVLCHKARIVEGAPAVDKAIGELTREDGFTAQTH